MKYVKIYTDGACSGNPGPGGYGIVLNYNGTTRKMSGNSIQTTNNRMELTAVIEALKALKMPCQIDLFSDSKYITDAINKGWLESWSINGWKKSNNKACSNVDLWQELLRLLKIHNVNFIWVKGHSGQSENEQCDKMAVQAIKDMKNGIHYYNLDVIN